MFGIYAYVGFTIDNLIQFYIIWQVPYDMCLPSPFVSSVQ